jgi:VWFA-related protein
VRPAPPRRALPAALALGAAAGAGAARIAIASPDGRAPVFGPVEIAVELESPDPISELRLFVDGSLVARLARPPWRARHDVGQFNVEHHFVAEATTRFGARLRATRTTPAVAVDDQVEVELVQLFVRVAAKSGPPPRDLGPDPFRVTDEAGERMPVTTVAGGGVPISTVVLVDSSDSMRGEPFRRALAGAQTAAGLLGPEDEVMVAHFSDRLLRATDFTCDRGALASALEGVEASGGSAVFDHLYFALNRLKTRLGRPVAILFSDGEDVTSALDAEDFRWRARRSQATLYWVRVAPEARGEPRRYATFWRDEPECTTERRTLEAAVAESGGGIVEIRSVAELNLALIRIFDDLRSQVVVGFHPKHRRHDGSWRPIYVRAASPGLSTTARAGYGDD